MRFRSLRVGTWLWQAVLLGFFALFLIYPVGYVLRHAFVDAAGRWTGSSFLLLASDPLQRTYLLHSFLIATVTTLLTLLIALPLSYIMTHLRFPGKPILGSLLLLPMILPPFVGAIGMQKILGRFGILNLALMKLGLLAPQHPIPWLSLMGPWGIILIQILGLFPIAYLNVSAAMANIDPSLRDAALNLGASPWRVFRTITLPLVIPGIFAGASIIWIWSFTDLGTPLVFGYERVVAVQIFNSLHELNTNPMGYALVVCVLGITSLLYILSRRFFASIPWENLSRGTTEGLEKEASPLLAVLIWIGCGLLLLLALLPHLAVVLHSLSQRWFFSIGPTQWTLGHYKEIFQAGGASQSIQNSLFYASLSACLDGILGIGIAWLLTRRRTRLASVFDTLAMLPLAIPGLVLAFGFVAGFNVDVDWINPRTNPTFLLIVAYAVRRLPYMVRAAVAGFQQSPQVLEEASANLGAGPFTTFRRITFPLIRVNLVAGMILTFAFAMLEVSDSLILAMRQQYFPITKMIYDLLGRVDPNAPSLACAMGVVGMVVLGLSLLLATLLLGRRMSQLFRF